MLRTAANAVTDLGDSALLLPIAALIFTYLLLTRLTRTALGWAAAIGFCLSAMATLKIGFHACGSQVLAGTIASPSGHAAFSTAIYGSLAVLLRRGLPGVQRFLPPCAAALLVGAIAFSRIMLKAHSPLEVAIGLAVGLLSVALFAVATRKTIEPPINIRAAFTVALLLGIALYGTRLPAEGMLHRLAAAIRSDIDICV